MLTATLIVSEAVLLLILIHPYVTYPASLLFFSRRAIEKVAGAPLGDLPSVAICMSIYNEERVVVQKAQSLLEMARAYGPATVHIYVDGADDRTVERLEPFRDQFDVVVSTERRGKTAGLNSLLKRSDSALVAFTDGNVRTAAGDLARLASAFADPSVGCASARLRYSNAPDTGTSAVGAAYWSLEEHIKSLESRTIGVVGVDGAFFVVDRACYRPAPDPVIDDLWVSLSVLLDGRWVVSVPDVVVTERSAVHWREEYRRKARIACQAVNVHMRLWPQLRRLPPAQLYGYLSHRLMKWLTPFVFALAAAGLLLLAGGAFGAWKVAEVVIGGALAFGLAAAAGFPPARLAIVALVSLAGVGAGVVQSVLLGKTYQYWTPAASVRD